MKHRYRSLRGYISDAVSRCHWYILLARWQYGIRQEGLGGTGGPEKREPSARYLIHKRSLSHIFLSFSKSQGLLKHLLLADCGPTVDPAKYFSGLNQALEKYWRRPDWWITGLSSAIPVLQPITHILCTLLTLRHLIEKGKRFHRLLQTYPLWSDVWSDDM